MSKFRRLAITHAAMMGGDAAMLVALADSLFLSIDPSAARGRVLLFLVVSFAPFLVIAPLIGPMIDRAAGGRRTVIQLVAGARVLLAVLMARFIGNVALFPLVFASLVLQKTYLVSKQALVPSVVRTEAELVEANSKLGLIAGLTGFVAILPAALIQVTPLDGAGTLIYSGLLFAFALLSASRLPADVVAARPEQPAETHQLHSRRLQLAAAAMVLLRAATGFLFFLLAFWLRTQSGGTFWFGAAIGMSALSTMAGNSIAPGIRRRLREEVMMAGALGLSALAGVVAALAGGPVAGVILAAVLNFSGAIARLAFESIVQRDAPEANRGRAFARFETHFQLAWAVAGVVPILITIPGPIGFLIVGLICAAALVNYVVGQRSMAVRRGRGSRPAGAPSAAATAAMTELAFTSGGRRLIANLVEPEGVASGAGLLFVHGLGSSQRGYLERAGAAADGLGCTCLTFDLSGHGASEADLSQLFVRDHLADVVTAYDTLAAQSSVDADRVGVCGASYGAYLSGQLLAIRPVARLLLRAPALYDDGVLDLRLRELRPARRMPEADEFLGALGRFEHETLVVESERDETIPHRIIQRYLDVVAHGHHRVIAGASHDLGRDDWRAEFRQILVDWFRPL